MKILVIGASGLVGSHVLEAGRRAGHSVVGTFRETSQPGLLQCDATDTHAVATLLASEKPDAVVYCAGWTWVDGCESDLARAMRENAESPAAAAKLCTDRGIHFTGISTSYVFDGRHGPYTEDAEPNPISVYSKSKLLGERLVLEATDGAALIPRLICVYGAETRRKNFAWQVLAAMKQGKTLILPSDQEGNPSYAGDIARWLVTLLEQRASGIWHLAGPWPECKRTEWAQKLVETFQVLGVEPKPDFAIRAVPTAELKQPALRPLKAGMLSPKSLAMGFEPTEFTETVRRILAGQV